MASQRLALANLAIAEPETTRGPKPPCAGSEVLEAYFDAGGGGAGGRSDLPGV
jgi:hypothetical protein